LVCVYRDGPRWCHTADQNSVRIRKNGSSWSPDGVLSSICISNG
jgi:hypothetical protein